MTVVRVEKSYRRFTAIFRSSPSGTLQHCSRGEGERSRTPMSSLKSFFYLLTIGLLLFPLLVLLGLSASRGDFHTAVGGGSWTPNLPMSSSKFIFFLLTNGPPLLFLPVLLELSSLTEPYHSVEEAAHKWRQLSTTLDHSHRARKKKLITE